MNNQKFAAELAPAIRVLLAKRGCVCFTDEIFDGQKELETLRIGGSREEMEEALKRSKGMRIDVVQAEGVGTFCIGKSKPDADNVLAVLKGTAKREIKTPRTGRLRQKLAVITGGASGFGEGMGRSMAEEGAVIGIADINMEAAAEKARILNEMYGDGTAMPLFVDVTEEQKTEEMIREFVLAYGGLDIFIMSAGVSHGGGLDTMDMKTFEFMTKMNYTSVYIGTKFAAPVMKTENRFDPEFTADIIQINSKSGLDGSINNFTYAGAKFGGIGLVQSFAKELVGNGIKVNAICPGNYYDGPMWSDPVKGLFVQYLKVGKVPGAKTVEDVRKYHVDKTPMKRGCTPKDVVRAVYYCVEQQYETGQAIPVSGGQIMLK
ncbi:SDR family NAD(P)-dependent oxidoreductase [Christensenella tenuis]|uniref:SDR family NAD(P)-dependent oxidoreductase n=1 Tax=Christensenella tenuis TaxID=2763033 RepID=A0ABR7EHG0_9FIRM|nr:SDR family NAD(P)-dependent oxidoreductase [Christensenella tenuis]MBC5649216.1 SDR family NAD(P)-dependent oxidoreductase [Christensenella tenuis]